jgi:hypothetical protein
MALPLIAAGVLGGASMIADALETTPQERAAKILEDMSKQDVLDDIHASNFASMKQEQGQGLNVLAARGLRPGSGVAQDFLKRMRNKNRKGKASVVREFMRQRGNIASRLAAIPQEESGSAGLLGDIGMNIAVSHFGGA